MRAALVANRGSRVHSGWPRAAALPDRLPGGADHQIAVLGPHPLIGCILAMARALPCRFLMVGEPLRRGPRAEPDRGFQQRALDEPALTAPLALVECRENPLHRPHSGAEIADRQPDRSRRAVRLAGHMHDPAHSLRDQVEPAAAGGGTVIAKPGQLGIDQPRIDVTKIVITEPGARHHIGPVILDQNIAHCGEAQKQCLALGRLVIERDPLFVAVDVAEIGIALVAPGAD
jgi:hypothetical protein